MRPKTFPIPTGADAPDRSFQTVVDEQLAGGHLIGGGWADDPVELVHVDLYFWDDRGRDADDLPLPVQDTLRSFRWHVSDGPADAPTGVVGALPRTAAQVLSLAAHGHPLFNVGRDREVARDPVLQAQVTAVLLADESVRKQSFYSDGFLESALTAKWLVHALPDGADVASAAGTLARLLGDGMEEDSAVAAAVALGM